MEKGKKLLKKIRDWELEILCASPKRAGKLASKIAKGKGRVFNER